MQRQSAGRLIFVGAMALATALYYYSSPGMLPWLGAEPLARLGLWRRLVRLFNGDVVLLAGTSAAVAGGLLGTVANRYFGWRVAVAAALAWITMPWVWNGVVLGRSSVCVASGAVASVWALNALVLKMSWRVCKSRKRKDEKDPDAEDVEREVFLSPRSLAWKFLIAGAAFAVISAANHDWRLGRAAGIYARGVVEEAAGRIIVLNGVADEQVGELVGTVPKGTALSFSQAGSDHEGFGDWVKQAWPAETNLWLTAQIGAETFARTAVRRFPGRFYLMTGASTTLPGWSARWERVAPFCKSSDPFIPVMRRAFAVEGNALGNSLQAAGKAKEAWEVYWRVFTEIEPDNSAALVNLRGMLHGGYAADERSRSKVETSMTALLKRTQGRRRSAAAGKTEAAQAPAETVRPGEKRPPEEIRRRLVAWSNEMIAAYDAGDLDKAERIARSILSRDQGRGWRPAYAVLGAALARDGEYELSEICYRVVVEGAGMDEPRAALHNDYADTLRHLGRFAEAERHARLAVAETGGRAWLCKLTLAEVLKAAGKNPDEVRSLVAEVEAAKQSVK